jgi:hypothetical protein
MAGLFTNYRSAHHPDAPLRLQLATSYLLGEIDSARAQRILRQRDRRLWLEMESSALAGILIEPFVRAFPRRKFVLTMRDVFTWCDSWIDHNINSPPAEQSAWAALDRVRLRIAEFPATKYDAPLIARGCAPLACYLQLWASHNTGVLEAVPADRLLVVETRRIGSSLREIAEWVGAPAQNLPPEQSWLFKAPAKHRVLSTLDPAYVRDTAEQFCAPLMRRYFSDVWSATSARAS